MTPSRSALPTVRARAIAAGRSPRWSASARASASVYGDVSGRQMSTLGMLERAREERDAARDLALRDHRRAEPRERFGIIGHESQRALEERPRLARVTRRGTSASPRDARPRACRAPRASSLRSLRRRRSRRAASRARDERARVQCSRTRVGARATARSSHSSASHRIGCDGRAALERERRQRRNDLVAPARTAQTPLRSRRPPRARARP